MAQEWIVELTEPPAEHQDTQSGLMLRWTGQDVVVEAPSSTWTDVAGGTAQVCARDVLLLQSVKSLDNFMAGWQFYTSCPGHFGAVPITCPPDRTGGTVRWRLSLLNRPARWVMPTSEVTTGLRPCLSWCPPSRGNSLSGQWSVGLAYRDSSEPVASLAQIPWWETDRVRDTVQTLQDTEYWLAVAALAQPDALAAARVRFERERARERRMEERLAEQHMLYDEFLAPGADLRVNVRKVARILRQEWASRLPSVSMTGRTLQHIDVVHRGERIRAAEVVHIEGARWERHRRALTSSQRAEVLTAFRQMLSPIGYDAVATKTDEIIIGRDRAFLIRHYRALLALEDARGLELDTN